VTTGNAVPATGAATGGGQRARTRRAAIYRVLRRLHLWMSLVAAVPLVLASLTGALLVFGHELDAMLVGAPQAIEPAGPPVSPQTLVDRVAAERPDVRVWAAVVGEAPDRPWTLWLADGAGVLEFDPYRGEVLRHYRPDDTPYGVVRALHRRWLVDARPYAGWARNAISAVSLVLMVQVLVGVWMWGLPGKRLARLTPSFRHSRRLALQRLHMLAGVVSALLLLLVAFTGMAMFWQDSTRAVVEAVTGSPVEEPQEPSAAGLHAVADLDAAVALARAAMPHAELESFRPARGPGQLVHVGFRSEGTVVPGRVWVGDDPPRVLGLHDGRDATLATQVWHLRYWLHVGDFAGWPVRALWVVVALMPAAFVVTGLWLWRDRHRRGRARR
jgi:uncharacterized iron-regulated membrane protein